MYKLPPQKLGNLDESKRITFVRSKEVASTSKQGVEISVPESSATSEPDNDYWEIIESSRKNVKKEVKDEPDVIVLDDDNDDINKQSQPPKRLHRKITRKKEPESIYLKTINVRDVNAFLKAAKDGDLGEVERYLKMGVSIDSVDFFGWSALMCAIAEGHFEVCKFLLENRANPAFVDSRGRGIGEIAAENGQKRIIRRLFEHFCPNEDRTSTSKDVEQMTVCEICDVCIPVERVGTHLTSIAHQLNDEKAKGAVKYSGIMIGPSNIGFRLMCASGWTEDQGLGKNGDGARFPIRTILKRNRAGLGLEKTTPRVTHFGPFDPNSVKAVKKKKEPIKPAVEWKKKKRKEDRIAKEFRSGFADSDSVYDYFKGRRKDM